MSEADKKKATSDWARFKKTLSKELAIVAEYAHIWGTTYNGMILVESRDLSTFHDFWHRFREATRWYVPETRTYIAQKEEKASSIPHLSTKLYTKNFRHPPFGGALH